MPPVPKKYAGPVIQNKIEQSRENCFVVTNDAHNRGTYPGYARNDAGRFYCH